MPITYRTLIDYCLRDDDAPDVLAMETARTAAVVYGYAWQDGDAAGIRSAFCALCNALEAAGLDSSDWENNYTRVWEWASC